MPKLRVFLPVSEVTHDLLDETITIGRVAENNIQIEDPSVSSRHAELVFVDGDYQLRDLDSTNGTRVNGENVQQAALQDGDKIRFGQIEAAYISENSKRASSEQALPLPQFEEHPISTPATASKRPTDFSNSSPFKKKTKKKDPAAAPVFALAGVAVAVFLAATVMLLTL